MPRPSKRRRYLLEEEESQSQEHLGEMQDPEAMQEEGSSSSTCSSSLPSSSSSSCYPLLSVTPEELSTPETPSPSLSPPGMCLADAEVSEPESPAQEMSTTWSPDLEGPSTSAQALQALQAMQAMQALQAMQAMQTVQPTQTVQATQTVQVAQATQSVQTAQATQSVQTAQATQSVQTAQATQSVQTAQATQSVQTVQATQAMQAVQVAQAMQAVQVPRCTARVAVDDEKVADLVQFLLLKYRAQEPTSWAEMLREVLGGNEEQFPDVFTHACECMQLVFGLDVKEVDPQDHSYVLENTLGLTYDGLLCGGQNVPKTGILVLILSIIFIEGNSAAEEEIWRALEVMGVCAGAEHFIFGDPKELLTEVWVREQYLEYRQVPGSDPPRYEFLWGPRAHAETNKMKVLEFLARVHGSNPRSFPLWYEEALRDLQERTEASMDAPQDEPADTADVSSTTGPSDFPQPE
ncbi:PREDICTED: melanoma-associated antigen 10-like [Condylura cristata]|uniref:melanoma-associated antigen 10-like n=1 Tax=Condylura cristata TaxID=143302 RepID=UPI000334323C|nr:PREDICTED: melanoma-associated antigen 10-like [Condylura cristata]